MGPPLFFTDYLEGSKKLTSIRERQEGRERQSHKQACEIPGRGRAGGAGRGAGVAASRARWIRIGIPRRAAGCVPAPFPQLRGSARGQAHCSTPRAAQRLGGWRGPAGDLHALQSQRFKVRSAGRTGAPPGPGAIFRPWRREFLAPAPGPPLRVNGRAPPPPSEALCVPGPASWAREGRASSPGAGPCASAPAHANQPGSVSGRAARWALKGPCQGGPQPPLWPGGPRSLLPGFPTPCASAGSPVPLHHHPFGPRDPPLPAAPVEPTAREEGQRPRTGPWGSRGILSGEQVQEQP